MSIDGDFEAKVQDRMSGRRESEATARKRAAVPIDPGWDANEILRPKRGPDGQPLGPISLPAPIPEVIAAKNAELTALMEETPIREDLIAQMLRIMNELSAFLEPLITDYVAVLRNWGGTWEQIGETLHVSADAAWEKFRHVDGTRARGVVNAAVGGVAEAAAG